MPAKAKLVTRNSTTSTVTTDNLNKGSALEFAELDSNMINLRDQTFGVVGDDSATIDVAAGGTLYIQGGTNCTTSTNSDGTITINSSAANDVFKTIAVSGQSDVVADASTDTLTLVGGSNMTITTNAGTDTITFASAASGSTGTLTISDNQIKTDTTTAPVEFTGSGDAFTTIEASVFDVDVGSPSSSNKKFRLDQNGLTSTNGLHTLKLSGQEHASDTENDANIGQFYFKHIEYHNTNTYHSIRKGGDLVFRGNLSAGDTADTGGFYPVIALREYEDDGSIEITPKPGQAVEIDGVNIQDNTISSNASNANLEISANGTGTIVLENLKVGTSGATVTTILDEDAMGTNSATALATQQSIRAYVDANVGSAWRVFGDDSAGVDIATGGSLYIRGGDNVTTSTNSDGTITITASGTSLSGSTNNTIATVTGANALIGEANATFDGSTLAITGNITATTSIATDAISLDDNVIKTTRSNDDLRIAGSGTGQINISPQNVDYTAYSSSTRWNNGTNIVHQETGLNPNTMTGSGDRRYGNNRISKYVLDGTDSAQGNSRFRQGDVVVLDLNGSSLTSTGVWRGPVANFVSPEVINSSGDDVTCSNVIGVQVEPLIQGSADQGDITITTLRGVSVDNYMYTGANQTITFTNAYGFIYEGGFGEGDGTEVITNDYAFYVDKPSWGQVSTNKWAFYDADPSGQSLFGDVKIKGNTISTNSSNANLELSGNSSGNVNILDGLQIGTSGATVTTILDEDAMGTNSATALATQQSIKAYVDSQVTSAGQGWRVFGDDSAGVDIAEGGSLYLRGGDNVTTSTNSDGTVTITASASSGATLTGSTNNTLTTVTGANAFQGEANATFDGSTLAITGNITATTSIANDHITIDGNEITTSSTNADLELSANGTGRVIIAANGADFAATSTAARYNNSNTLLFQDLTHTIANERVYGNNMLMDIKLDAGQDTANSNDRWRNWFNTIFDLNGSSSTATSSYLTRGPVAGAFELHLLNNSTAGESHLGNAAGVQSGIWCSSSANSSILFEADDSSSTNVGMAAYTSWVELEAASGATVSIPNVYSYFAKGIIAYGAGTEAVTNAYAFYASENDGASAITNQYAFYDANDSGTSKFGDIQISGNNITTLSSNADLELQTAGTGNIVLNDISISDNKIHANRSNDTLFLEPAGTGLINIGNADFQDDTGSLFSNAYGSLGHIKGTAIVHEDLTHTPGGSRVYGNVFQTSVKTDGADTTSGEGRVRGVVVNTALDLNGSSMTHSSYYRGAQGINAQSFITNTSSDDAVLSTATGFVGYVFVQAGSGSGDLTITNAIGCSASSDFDAGNLAADKTLTITNSYGFMANQNWLYGGSATKVCTNQYSFYAAAQTLATNNWLFYDATSAGTNSQNRLGAIQLINQSSAPTNLANHSWIYALDDSASSEVYVKDEAGNATKISPHNEQGEWEFYSKNSKTGKTFRVNMEKMIKKIEELTGETFIETN